MRKAFVPLLASLLLCGAATGALVATGAQAQTGTRNPVMLAQNNETPPANMDRMHRFNPADMAARHKQRCEDGYAQSVGRMAYLETRLNLTGPQQSLFSAWRSVRLGIAKRHADACTQHDVSQVHEEVSPVDRMARMEDRLKKRIADLEAERPAFAALYGALSPDQQKALAPHRHGMMRGHRGMRGHGMMGRGVMRPRPMNGQPPAPPPQ
ncbi:MAG TPA: Spy/CpxP family protein refolding chaperone [Rhizomicrobium sp.]|nr:Spy/CpxP family protein refolding chaperone [Rhizomicrobium sp.]